MEKVNPELAIIQAVALGVSAKINTGNRVLLIQTGVLYPSINISSLEMKPDKSKPKREFKRGRFPLGEKNIELLKQVKNNLDRDRRSLYFGDTYRQNLRTIGDEANQDSFKVRNVFHTLGGSLGTLGARARMASFNMMEIVGKIRANLIRLFEADTPEQAKISLMQYTGYGEARVDRLLKRERNAGRRRGVELSFADLCVNVLLKKMEKKAKQTVQSNLSNMATQTENAIFAGK